MSSDQEMSENDKKIEDTISKILVLSATPGAITQISGTMSSDWEMSENNKKIEDIISKILVLSATPGAITNKIRPNCVDQFNKTHQDEREARVRVDRAAGAGLMQRVNHHNSACPKMYDELKKRRSIMQITTIKSERLRDFHPDCVACAKLITLRELTEQNVKPRCQKSRHTVKVKRCGTAKQRKPCAGARPRTQPGPRLSRTSDDFHPEIDTQKKNERKPKPKTKSSVTSFNSDLFSYSSDFSFGREPMVSDNED